MSCCWPECVVVLTPYPNNPNPVKSFNIKTDFDIRGNGLVWYARPQLFFNCTLCLTGAKGCSSSDKEVSLVYSTRLSFQSDLWQCHAASWRAHAI